MMFGICGMLSLCRSHYINPYIPEFLTRTLPSFTMPRFIVANIVGLNYRMANSVELDESSHLDLNCLQKYLYWSIGTKGLKHLIS